MSDTVLSKPLQFELSQFPFGHRRDLLLVASARLFQVARRFCRFFYCASKLPTQLHASIESVFREHARHLAKMGMVSKHLG